MVDSSSEWPSAGATVDPVREISDAIWRELGRHRGVLDLTELGEIALVLVYLRSRPVWETLTSGSSAVEQAIRADLVAERHDRQILRPLLDLVRSAEEARQLPELVRLVGRYDPATASFAQVFSSMLDRMALDGGRKGAGEFHTPRSIADLAAALLAPAPNSKIFDPCCKAGGFSATMLDRIALDGHADGRPMVAISDYSIRSCALAYLNLRMRGVTPEILPNPTESLWTGAPDQRFDVVTANPPFNLTNWSHDRSVEGRWRYGLPPTHNSNYAWLQYVVASLDDGGRAAVVMPHGAGFSENSQERSIRSAMVEDGVLSAVIALPGQMFAHTAIPVTMWLFKRSSTVRPAEVLFVDASELGTTQERGRRTLATPAIGRIVATYIDWCERRLDAVEGFAAGVSVERIRDAEYRLNPRAYIATIDELPDLDEQSMQVREMVQRLHGLAEQVAGQDRTIEAYLKELSL